MQDCIWVFAWLQVVLQCGFLACTLSILRGFPWFRDCARLWFQPQNHWSQYGYSWIQPHGSILLGAVNSLRFRQLCIGAGICDLCPPICVSDGPPRARPRHIEYVAWQNEHSCDLIEVLCTDIRFGDFMNTCASVFSLYWSPLIVQPLCCICWQISLLGIRVGEASHPGPETSTVRFTALNPTAVHNKSTRLVDCGDVLLLAETSHTTKACSLETVAFRKLRFKSVWGDAVPSMHHTAHDESLRGTSGGVSFHSRFPVRPTRDVFPAAWAATTRIVEGYVQLPSLVVRVFSIYGLPRGGSTMSNNKAEAATNCLLQMILQRLQLNGTPTVIGGDLNRKVTHCEAWKEFQQKGFVELHDFWKESRGVDLPPTCKTRNATTGTRHDTLLIDPRLVPLLTNACVLTEKAFDIHYPVCADFQFPKCQLYRSVWKLPASMHELEPDLQLFSRVYEENHSEIDGVVAGPSDDASLQTWSEYGQSMLSVLCVTHCSNSTKLTPSGTHSMDCPHDTEVDVFHDRQYTPFAMPDVGTMSRLVRRPPCSSDKGFDRLGVSSLCSISFVNMALRIKLVNLPPSSGMQFGTPRDTVALLSLGCSIGLKFV